MWWVAAAVVQLKGVASLVVSDGNTPDLVILQLGFLQTLLSNIVSIVANYIDLEDKHRKSSTAVESRWDQWAAKLLASAFSSFYEGNVSESLEWVAHVSASQSSENLLLPDVVILGKQQMSLSTLIVVKLYSDRCACL